MMMFSDINCFFINERFTVSSTDGMYGRVLFINTAHMKLEKRRILSKKYIEMEIIKYMEMEIIKYIISRRDFERLCDL